MHPQKIGRIGVWTFAFDTLPAAELADAASELETLGYDAIWFGEAFGRDAFTQAAHLLSATSTLRVATGIANINLRLPLTAAAAERSLAEAYPDRFLLGLGGHAVRDQQLPPAFEAFGTTRAGVADLAAYLDRMNDAPLVAPAAPNRPPRLLAALGPRMLRLAGDHADGAHTYFVPPEHTARARELLGPDRLLVVEQAVLPHPDLTEARATARAHVAAYLSVALHHRNNLRRLGFADADLADGGSDRVVDAIVAYGSLADIERRVRAHLDAGADQVCLQVLSPDPRPAWRELADVLL